MFEFGKEGANVACAWLLQHITHVLRWANVVTWRGCCRKAEKDRCSNGRRMFEGFHDWAVPLGRGRLGGINSAIKEGLGFVWTILTVNERKVQGTARQNQFSNSSKCLI